jgi:hypothetical protein
VKKIKAGLLGTALILLFAPSVLRAQTTQLLNAVVEPDYTLTLDQSLPVDTRLYDSVDLSVPQDVGSRNLDYEFVKAYDSIGPVVSTEKEPGRYLLKFNSQNNGIQGMHIIYKVKPTLLSATSVFYDLTPQVDDIFLKSPTLTLTYPSSLKLIDSDPPSISDSPVQVAYPLTPNGGLFLISFLKNPLPSGYTTATEGIFHIVGTPAQVERLVRIVHPLTFAKQAFTDTLGNFGHDEVWVVVNNLSGQGGLVVDAGGIMRGNKVIEVDPEDLTNGSNDTVMGELILHELTHSVVQKNTFHKEEKVANWFDEGMAVFIEHYFGKKYLHDPDYFIAPGPDGTNWVYQDLYQHFSENDVLKRYQKPFAYDVPKTSADVDDFYTHAGLVFENFHALVGDEGMKTFMQKLNQLHSSGTDCLMCDTNRILGIMSQMTGWTSDQLLFPYKGLPTFHGKIQPFIRNKLTQNEIDAILANYAKNKPLTKPSPAVIKPTTVIVDEPVKVTPIEETPQPVPVEVEDVQDAQKVQGDTRLGFVIVITALLVLGIGGVIFIRGLHGKGKSNPMDRVG